MTKYILPLIQNSVESMSKTSDRVEVLPNGNGVVLRNVNVLFQGIGTKTLIAIPSSKKEIRLPIPSQDVVVISTIPSDKL